MDSKRDIISIIKTIRDDEKIIEIALQACSAVVKGSFLKTSTAKWFGKQAGVEEVEDSDPKFGDGIDKASGANKPSEILKLRFYEPTFKPYGGMLDSSGQNELYTSISQWSYPTGPLWASETMSELRHNANVVVDHHSGGEPTEVVLPLYLYSASQKGLPYVWAIWNSHSSPCSWSVVNNKHLEKSYQDSKGGMMVVEKDWFSEIFRKSIPTGSVPIQKISVDDVNSPLHGYIIDGIFHVEKKYFTSTSFQLIRYQLNDKSHSFNPLLDTVAWLPRPVVGNSIEFETSLCDLPPCGVVEYLYSRRSDETISWASDWKCHYALGGIALMFISQLFEVPNQQEYNSALHSDFKAFINMLSSDKVDDRFVELIAEASKDDTTETTEEEDEKSFLKAMNYFSEMRDLVLMLSENGLNGNIIKEAIQYKIGSNTQPPPMALAHALEIQYLCWKKQSYLLLLSGARPCCVASGKVVPLQRLNITLDNQIFWQLNYTMRMYQWGCTPKIHINKVQSCTDLEGKYQHVPDSDQFISKKQQIAFSKNGNWLVSKTNNDSPTHEVDDYWFEAATWLLKPCSPLMYFIDKAIELAKDTQNIELKSYRGIKNVSLPRTLYAEDNVVLWGAYSSTSGDRGVATSFAGDDTKVAVFSLTGSTPILISRWSRYGRERELLYPANTQFQVTSSLSEEQQEILGKKNLQIFSMTEVDEKKSLLAYLRGLVNHVVGTEKASKMPKHVKQIFKIMQFIEDEKYSAALRECCNPDELVVETDAGRDVSHLLQQLDESGSLGVVANIARYNTNMGDPATLQRLVMAGEVQGLEPKDAIVWLYFFEDLERIEISTIQEIVSMEMKFRIDIIDDQLRKCSNFNSHLLNTQLVDLSHVLVSGLTDEATHFNGYYEVDDKRTFQSAVDHFPTFTKINSSRVESHEKISYDTTDKLWTITDTEMRSSSSKNEWKPVNDVILTWGCQTWHQHCDFNMTAKQQKYGTPVVKVHTMHYLVNDSSILDDEGLSELNTLISELQDENSTDGTLQIALAMKDKKKINYSQDVDLNNEIFKIPCKPESIVRSGDVNFNFEFKTIIYHKKYLKETDLSTEPVSSDEENDRSELQNGFILEIHPNTIEDPIITQLDNLTPVKSNWRDVLNFGQYLSAPNVIHRLKQDVAHRRNRPLENSQELNTNFFREYIYYEGKEEFKFFSRWRKALKQSEIDLKTACEIGVDDQKISVANKRRDRACEIALEKKPPMERMKRTFSEVAIIPSQPSVIASRANGLLTVGVGQAGCYITQKLWELYAVEHNVISSSNLEALNPLGAVESIFAEKNDGRWVPRSVFVDCEIGTPDTVRKNMQSAGLSVEARDFVSGGNGSSCIYPRGYYDKVTKLKSQEAVRRHAEELDSVQGILLNHSIGGGTGSGMGMSLFNSLRDYFPKSALQTYGVLPSQRISQLPVEPLNFLLAMSGLMDNATFCCLFDNQSIYRLLSMPSMVVPKPNFSNINRLIAHTIASVTCSTRFPSQSMRVDLKCLETNLVPYQEMHFVVPSFSPLISKYTTDEAFSAVPSVAALTKSVISTCMSSVNITKGKLLGCHLQYRGDVSEGLANLGCRSVRTTLPKCSWQPCAVKSATSTAPPGTVPDSDLIKLDRSVVMLSNSSAVGVLLRKLSDTAARLQCYRAYYHWYVGNGIDEGEFSEARCQLESLDRSYGDVIQS